ncbi:hypothetical protein MFLAVUS_010410 [Mucor flavus]|uniref:Uncharacterized protein n=1 Tax=Mucor flavus TaxID=439312 RepID=A0ABP9ZCQ9_9FUNG
MKLWGEILELLVGDSSELYVNWGETSTDTTTAVKRINNDNKPHTIGCKVDGRIVCKVSEVVDTCHVEAARASSSLDKIHSDKFKLAAESKCTIDDMVMSGKLKNQKAIILQNMQIFGILAEVCTLKLIDCGLYVNRVEFDLSLCTSLNLFADKLIMWIRQLKSLKKNCLNIAALSNEAYYTQPTSFSEIFGRGDSDDDNSKYCSPEWVTGTILPPTTKPALLPKQLLTSPTTLSRNRSLKRKLPEFYLDDNTKVVSKFNKKDQKKQQHDTDNDS